MNTTTKWLLSTALVGTLSACGGSISDSFFQADGTTAGIICIDGVTISPNGNEAKETVTHLKKFYGGDLSGTSTVYSGVGPKATCIDYADKPKANIIITKDYYEKTIIPATPL